MMSILKSYALIPVVALLLASAQAMWSQAIKNDQLITGSIPKSIVKVTTNPKIILGFILYAATTALYFYLLSKLPFFTIQTSVTALVILFSTTIAYFLLQESISIINMVGILFVISGLTFVFWK